MNVLSVFELTILVLALLAPGFARGLAKLLTIHANALEGATRTYRKTWNGGHRRKKTLQLNPAIPAAMEAFVPPRHGLKLFFWK